MTVYTPTNMLSNETQSSKLPSAKQSVFFTRQLFSQAKKAPLMQQNSSILSERNTTQTITLIFWDLGDVLVSLDFDQLFAKICPLFDTTPEAFHQALFTTGIFDRANRGQTTPREFHQEVQEAMHKQVSFEAFREAWTSFFQPRLRMGDLLTELNGSVSMWLLSNTDPLHHHACQEKYDYLQNLTGQLTSYGLGAMKPEAELYTRALRKVGRTPNQVLFFDDKSENIAGAQQVGIHAYLYESEEQCRKIIGKFRLELS